MACPRARCYTVRVNPANVEKVVARAANRALTWAPHLGLEDLTQQGWLAALEARASSGDYPPYLRVSVRRALQQYVRRSAVHAAIGPEPVDPHTDTPLGVEGQALVRLRTASRGESLLAAVAGEISCSDLSGVTGWSRGKAEYRISQTRRALARCALP